VKRARIVAVLNIKGGVGKTTLVTNLAAAAHLRGLSTLIVDLHDKGSASRWYEMRREGSKLEGLDVVKFDKPLGPSQYRSICERADLAFLDGPATTENVTRAAAVGADLVLVPVLPGQFDVWGGDETFQIVDQADEIRGEMGRPAVRRVLVVNQAAHTRVTQEAPEALRGLGHVAKTMLRKRTVYTVAQNAKETVLTYQPKGRAAEEVLALYREVMR
jgi:chromosome partitioning protein